MDILPYIWLFAAIFAVVLEAFTTALVAIWFIPSAIVTMILAFLKVPLYVQIVVFFALSALFIIFSRTIFKKALRVKPVPTNADALIGGTALVTERISNLDARGLVKIRGQIWSARSVDESIIEEGTLVKVISIEGVKLICKKDD